MNYLNLKLRHTKLKIIHFDKNSSDPFEHDHGDDFQISIPLKGEANVEMNKQIITLENSKRLITAPGEKHFHFTRNIECKLLLININKNFLESVIKEKLLVPFKDITFEPTAFDHSEKLIKKVDEMIRLHLFIGEEGKLEELEMELVNILLTIQNGSHSEKWRTEVMVKSNPFVIRAIDFIEKNFKEEIYLEEIAKEVNISKYYLLRVFKEATGLTPTQYITNRRLNYAVGQLIQTNHDITAICFESGFGSLNTFERVFKHHFGKTITQYRKLHK